MTGHPLSVVVALTASMSLLGALGAEATFGAASGGALDVANRTSDVDKTDPAAGLGASPCRVVNVTTGTGPSSDLQFMIDSASRGDQLRLVGVCRGNFKISKTLGIVGKATAAHPTPSLDGRGAGTVLKVGGSGDRKIKPVVRLKDVSVLGGVADENGGGIAVMHGLVSLRGSTSVTSNEAAQWGGGVYVREGLFKMRRTSSVSGNSAQAGAGIYVRQGSLLVRSMATVSTNVADQRGGGIFNRRGGVTLADAAAVTGNAASNGGGIFTSRKSGGRLLLTDSSLIENNTATRLGGGVYNGGSKFRIRKSSAILKNGALRGGGLYLRGNGVEMKGSATVAENTANRGGGVYSARRGAEFSGGSSIVSNHANRGGGIFNNGRSTNLVLSGMAAVSGNSAALRGGGIYNDSRTDGFRGKVTMNDESSITANDAVVDGGGIFNDGGIIRLNDSSTVTGNTPNDISSPL